MSSERVQCSAVQCNAYTYTYTYGAIARSSLWQLTNFDENFCLDDLNAQLGSIQCRRNNNLD